MRSKFRLIDQSTEVNSTPDAPQEWSSSTGERLGELGHIASAWISSALNLIPLIVVDASHVLVGVDIPDVDASVGTAVMTSEFRRNCNSFGLEPRLLFVFTTQSNSAGEWTKSIVRLVSPSSSPRASMPQPGVT